MGTIGHIERFIRILTTFLIPFYKYELNTIYIINYSILSFLTKNNALFYSVLKIILSHHRTTTPEP